MAIIYRYKSRSSRGRGLPRSPRGKPRRGRNPGRRGRGRGNGVKTPAGSGSKKTRGNYPAGVGVLNIAGVFTPPGSGLNFLAGFLPRRGRGWNFFRGFYPAGVGVKKMGRGRGFFGVDPVTPFFRKSGVKTGVFPKLTGDNLPGNSPKRGQLLQLFPHF